MVLIIFVDFMKKVYVFFLLTLSGSKTIKSNILFVLSHMTSNADNIFIESGKTHIKKVFF